jgi:hypothetical protein
MPYVRALIGLRAALDAQRKAKGDKMKPATNRQYGAVCSDGGNFEAGMAEWIIKGFDVQKFLDEREKEIHGWVDGSAGWKPNTSPNQRAKFLDRINNDTMARLCHPSIRGYYAVDIPDLIVDETERDTRLGRPDQITQLSIAAQQLAEQNRPKKPARKPTAAGVSIPRLIESLKKAGLSSDAILQIITEATSEE